MALTQGQYQKDHPAGGVKFSVGQRFQTLRILINISVHVRFIISREKSNEPVVNIDVIRIKKNVPPNAILS